jgi:hypothetical protein
MSPESRFRKWAAEVARQAGEELDEAVANRLLGVAEHWVKLAEREETNLTIADLSVKSPPRQ